MPPIIYDENGTAKGVTVDIAKALGKKLVIKFILVIILVI